MMECKCTMAQKLNGDGCSLYNPKFYPILLKEQIRELKDELVACQQELAELQPQQSAQLAAEILRELGYTVEPENDARLQRVARIIQGETK